MKHSKRYDAAAQAVEKQTAYELTDALAKVVDTATSKFDETIELHIKLGVDARNADQQVRGVVVLPNGTGKKIRVLVIAKGDKANDATKAGADIVGAEEIIEKIQKQNWLDFDACITTPDMMGLVGRVARVLGPRGLMPNPKSGTVTPDVAKAVKDIKAGKVEYRLDKLGVVHVIIGKKSFGPEKLRENMVAVMDALIKAKPAAAKGTYLKSVYLASTMGPGIKVNYKMI